MANDQRLYMRQRQLFAQQRIIVEINLADGYIIGGAPIGVHLRQFIGRQGAGLGVKRRDTIAAHGNQR